MQALQTYVQGWLDADAEAIAASVASECVIVECYGPVYVGRERVRQWAEKWFRDGGIIHSWELADGFACADRYVSEWVFEFTWLGERSRFEGVSVVQVAGSQILRLREYRTTGHLYEWVGDWPQS